MKDLDEDLVERCRQGSVPAFEVLVQRYQPRIHGFLEKQLGSHEDAQDVTQRTFLQAYASLSRFKAGSRFAPWIFTIARRQGIDFLRHRGVQQRTHRQMREEPPPENPPDPRVLLSNQENADELWRWIWTTLDSRSREILWLKIQEELDTKEIARVMKLSRSHVKVLLYRARQTLIKALTPNADCSSRDPQPEQNATSSALSCFLL